MNKPTNSQFRSATFINYLRKVCDPQGLYWVIQTGRMSTYEIQKTLKINNISDLLNMIKFFGHNEYIIKEFDNKPRVQKQLKQLAEKIGNETREKYPLYTPNE